MLSSLQTLFFLNSLSPLIFFPKTKNNKTMSRFSFLVISLLSLCAIPASSDDKVFAKSLLKFKESLTNSTMLDNWQEPVDKLCSWNTPNWTGLLCVNGSFIGLRLENMSLGGKIDADSLSKLPLLSLSVMHNNFSGQFPRGIKRLRKLRSLYLANNSFSGEIGSDAFSGMKGMRKVVLGGNFFTGEIPVSLLELPKLVDLQFQGNRFRGRIPEFQQAGLIVNFANNKLEGAIPATLRNQKASSFLGNINLCGKPLHPCKPKSSIDNIAFVTAAILVAALAAFTICFLFYRRRAKPLKYQKSLDHKPNHKTITYKNIEQHGKLCFVRNDRERFELEELLRASAEVLGSGSYGSSYKASLFSGQVYVVRRFRHMSNAGKEDFYDHMRRLGRLSHRNVLPIVGFYYRREEKLLVTDYVENGSLASHLHGKRNPSKPGLDWPTRLRIIKGVARGLAHLYSELPTLTLPHGHLKSSNVLLDSTCEPILGDYALAPLINKDHAQEFMVAYKSPESTQNDRVTKKTDVWSLGILILELLTGRFPANYLKRGRGPSSDLATWVDSVAREECAGEVFDKDMNVAGNGEGQMLRLLKIGMCCCEWDVEKRWDLREAVERIEELKERDSDDDDDDCYSFSNHASYHHQGDHVYSSRAMSNGDF